jgi:hypothetical protein
MVTEHHRAADISAEQHEGARFFVQWISCDHADTTHQRYSDTPSCVSPLLVNLVHALLALLAVSQLIRHLDSSPFSCIEAYTLPLSV